MKQTFILITLIAGLFACQPKKTRLNYPMTKKVDTVDIYFGQQVPDPYRWLEDDRSDETAEWVKAQNEVTFAYLEKIPFRQQLRDRLTKIWNYLKISAPWHQSGHYFMFKNDGLQNQSVLYVKESLEGTERILLDPNTLSDDGTVALANLDISDDGKYLAYGIARGGSDWNEFYVKNIETNEQLSDQILWTKFSGISWFNDGFFYSRFPKPDESNVLKGMNENCKIYYHKIGTIQEEDKLIYEDTKHPQWTFYAGVTDDKKILIISVSESTSGNALYVKNLETNGPIIKLVETFNNDYGVVDHQDGKLLVQTNYKAPKYKLISIDLKNPASENWKDIIPEKEGVLSGVSVFKNKWMVQYSKDAHDLVELYNADGTYAQPLELPEICTVGGFNGEKEDSFTFYTITSFTTPSTVYKYDIETNKSELYLTSPVDFDGTKYETKQVFYTSKDGTKVPMFIVHKKDMKLDGKNPVLLYGYGGFNITYTPAFSLFRIMWLEQGGVFALAGLRGGGEYGEDWHKAGTLMQKQNVFDDCIAAAEYLINEKYTSAGKVALQGGSNGGLLVGAVINQRPDLYGVALPAVGVMDMLRYHKFTIGFHWATDYGTSEDSIEMFKYLLGYSPLHTIKENIEYPAVFVTTGDHDDRVVPAHSFKYAATLQEKYKGTNPVLIRIETNAGHGAGKPTAKIIDEYTDELAFAFYNLGMKPKFEDTAEKK
jgi:prolyl oligopeptidase